MNVVFLSNYLSHHQKPLSDALAAHCRYTFIATAEVPKARRELGWHALDGAYLCRYDREPEQAEQLLAEADVVIAGSAPERLVQKCIRRRQLVFRYSERPLKRGPEPLKYLPRLLRWHLRNPAGKPVYLLCAGGAVAKDYSRFGLFQGKALKWGYFPETRRYEVPLPKKPGTILWAGRFLPWKHPDHALRVAAELKEAGVAFHMTFIGTGPMEEELKAAILRNGLEDMVTLMGARHPEEVRSAMEEAEIFLFTSGREEGWGAVLNEAMNSGCAVVASHAAGATPYLIRNGENGLVYPWGNTDQLTAQVKRLLSDPALAHRLGREAYSTIVETWNGELAARRFLETAAHILAGRGAPYYGDGPCSGAVNDENSEE